MQTRWRGVGHRSKAHATQIRGKCHFAVIVRCAWVLHGPTSAWWMRDHCSSWPCASPPPSGASIGTPGCDCGTGPAGVCSSGRIISGGAVLSSPPHLSHYLSVSLSRSLSLARARSRALSLSLSLSVSNSTTHIERCGLHRRSWDEAQAQTRAMQPAHSAGAGWVKSKPCGRGQPYPGADGREGALDEAVGPHALVEHG